MTQTKVADRKSSISGSGLKDLVEVYYNLNEDELYNAAVERGEGTALDAGPLAVTTGKHTGRSARDKFIVRDDNTKDTIWWDNNAAMEPAHFRQLHEDMIEHAKGMSLFVQDLYGGADPDHRIKVRVVTEYAWHALFIRHMLRRPDAAELDGFEPDLTDYRPAEFQGRPGPSRLAHRNSCRRQLHRSPRADWRHRICR